MNDAQIREKLTPVFHDVFDDASIVLRDDLTAADVEGWDSLTYVDLIVAVEKAFRVSFTTKEVNQLANVGDLVRLIGKKSG